MEGTMSKPRNGPKLRSGKIMSPKLRKVAERAKRDPSARFNSLAHLIDEEALRRAYARIREDAAVGVDGIDKETYGRNLEANLRDLHGRLRSQRYRHQPIRRVHIPKGKGKTRPIGIATIEDKIVQGALTEVLTTVYEQDFRDCSHGFRPGRSAHGALRVLDRMLFNEGVEWVLEADIQSFFDSLDRAKLREFLDIRVADGSIKRLIGKCLHVGVLDGEEFTKPEEGTVQGSIISPLLGNVYLHYVLDEWFEDVVKPRLTGHARLIRYADDFVIGFRNKEDAERTLAALGKRMARFGLALHPEKTRLLPFRRPRGRQDETPGTFDFLGFTIYWEKTRKGSWRVGMKTRKASLRRAITSLSEWCRRHRHLPRKEQHATLSSKLRGHFQYFGVNGNMRSIRRVYNEAKVVWRKWLKRRSQRNKLDWERYTEYLKAYPLPAPQIKVKIWGVSP